MRGQVSLSTVQPMDTYRLQSTNAHIDHSDISGLSWLEQHSQYSLLRSEPLSTDSSPHSYYTANTPPSYITTNSTSTLSSNMSFPFSVTSINSHKSRKTVLYPRRVHPLSPVPVAPERSVSPDPLIWQVRFLCTTLLPCSETRLVPAGRVLLQSLGLHGDFSQHVPARTDEETRFCAELFIALTHDVLLRDAVSAAELESPCKLLHT
ncbi:hypothetical protein EI94DRAFT_148220 [Lactarius quietus]|nr:hypothetical protein EI94DRAFT_148220 [Lactarius quietus]